MDCCSRCLVIDLRMRISNHTLVGGLGQLQFCAFEPAWLPGGASLTQQPVPVDMLRNRSVTRRAGVVNEL